MNHSIKKFFCQNSVTDNAKYLSHNLRRSPESGRVLLLKQEQIPSGGLRMENSKSIKGKQRGRNRAAYSDRTGAVDQVSG